MPNFGFHIRHGDHSSDHNVDLPDARAAHNEATMIFGDLARDVAAQLNETPEWRRDVSDEFGKSLSGSGCLQNLSNRLARSDPQWPNLNLAVACFQIPLLSATCRA
jgi:hypothetical protein